jgi:carbon starvation protein CstA
MFMGVYNRFIRPGRVGEISLVGFVLLIAAIVVGGQVAESATWAPLFTFNPKQLTWMLIGLRLRRLGVAGVAAAGTARLPVDLPEDRHHRRSGLAMVFVAPNLRMPAVTQFIDGTGPAWSGSLFPFIFITIACGAVSGFHALISSGTTPKLLDNEKNARMIGYGGMLMESFVAIMAIVAASVIDPGVYFAMNSPPAIIGKTVEGAAQVISQWGFVITPEVLVQTARDVGENSILSRAGGAPTLAVGMAQIFSQVIGGRR